MKINVEFLHNLSKERYLSYIRAVADIHQEKVQTYATLILTLVACIFFGTFAIGPTLSTIAQLQKNLEESKFLEFQLQTKIANMTKLQDAYPTISPQLPLLYAAIPKSPEAVKLSGQLRALAVKESVLLSQLQVQDLELAAEEKRGSALQSIAVTIAVQGNLRDLKSFYDSLIAFDRLFTISSMTMLRPSESNSSVYRLIIQGKAYFRP